ncbi:hypothetical protein PuT2_06385 [Pusillimonas sp. T2]|uniref:hypothetical protein n=1 Tax=Pusillimonas sp. T2 TaxID=1548123 RepID=UPI000B9D49FF|nr:hypothetical protein [Pusillimonas sp. T2]OXR49433.1 hypothetical protein PuT2_06385 [Pusillimonas sp. T2]
MKVSSQIVSALPQGLILDVIIEDLTFTAYVVVSAPDIHLVAEFVSPEAYQQANDWHVTAIETADDAENQVRDIAFNMNLNDAAVFLCADTAAYEAALEALGQTPLAG